MFYQAPLFTLDGSRIVFRSGGDGKQYIMNLDGSEVTDLEEARSKYYEKVRRAKGQLE